MTENELFKWISVIAAVLGIVAFFRTSNTTANAAQQYPATTGGTSLRPVRQGRVLTFASGSPHFMEQCCGSLNCCATCAFGPTPSIQTNTEAAYYSGFGQPRHVAPLSAPNFDGGIA